MVMRERILVCIGEDSAGPDRVRYAAQLANFLQVGWTALNIQKGSQSKLSERERALIEGCIRLAQQLGGQTATLPGAGSAKEILALRATEQCCSDRGWPIAPLSVVRDAARLDPSGSRPHSGRHHCPCDRGSNERDRNMAE
jgi:hypothetical protein